MTTVSRLHFLDWLRVLAFGLLIFYHTGMLYVSWPYHVKSPRIFAGVEWAMVLANPWRLALLFFISGVACRFLLDKLGPAQLARDRLLRLLPVLVLGMLVVVPPQTYFELRQSGRWNGGYLPFWIAHYLAGDGAFGVIMPTWNHLWFLVYLLAYSQAFAVVAAVGRGRRAPQCPVAALMVAPAIWLAGTNVLASALRPDTHAFFDDWAGHLRWIGLFAAGTLAARSEPFWSVLRRRRRVLAGVAFLLAASLVVVRVSAHSGGLVATWAGPSYAIVSGAFGWVAILAILGAASEHLCRSSRALCYLNVAILPIYVLHQTVLIVLAVALFPARLPVWLEASAIVVGTLAISLATYELVIRRSRTLRCLFGLKRDIARAPLPRRVADR